MTPQTTSLPRTKGDTAPRTIDHAPRLDTSPRDAQGAPRTRELPQEDKYFDVPCTD